MGTKNNQLIFIKRNLYRLRQDYGKAIDIYSKMSILNYETGKQVVTRNKIHVKKAIVLPTADSLRGRSTFERAFLQTPVISSAFETMDRKVILEYRDLPKGFTVALDDYVIIDQRTRYQIKAISDYEFDTAIILTLKEAKGVELYQMAEYTIYQRLNFQQVVTSG